MALEREKFLVYLEDPLTQEVTVHSVTIRHVDMTRGELEHLRQGGPERGAGLNMATVWCWAALTRMGLYARSFPEFRDNDCVGLEDDGTETVDPTQPVTTELSV